MTVDDARQVFLSFPGSSEGEHHGHPDFRVGGKIFGSLFPDKDLAVVRVPESVADAAVEAADHRCRVAGRQGGMSWLAIEAGSISEEAFTPLAELAFESRR